MGYAFEGWKVTYTRRYDTDYGEYGTVTNVTIGDTNIPIGYHGIFSDGKGNENSLATESIARLIAAAPKLLETLEAVMRTINTPEAPDAELARGRAQLLLAELGHGTHKGEQGQEEIER